jgi:hypothetical protein
MVMKLRGFVLLLALVCLFGLVEARPERNAFVNKKVATVSQLIAQIRSDPQVRDRYMRHFAMSQDELIEYLSSLHPAQLEQGGSYTVYSVPEDGAVKVRTAALKKGERVFSDRSGTPVLLARCGNPLTLGPSQPEAINDLQPLLISNPSTDMRELHVVPDSMPEDTLVAVMPPSVGEIPVITTPPPTGGGDIPIAPPSGGGIGLGPLGLLGALGGAALINTGGGGGSAVPEPMTMLVLAGGFAGVLAKARRKR